nr:hypothetical protein [Brucella gallinifaecis]
MSKTVSLWFARSITFSKLSNAKSGATGTKAPSRAIFTSLVTPVIKVGSQNWPTSSCRDPPNGPLHRGDPRAELVRRGIDDLEPSLALVPVPFVDT